MIIELTNHAEKDDPHIRVETGFRRFRLGRFAIASWPDLDTEPGNPCAAPATNLEPSTTEPLEGLSAAHQAAIYAARDVAIQIGDAGASNADIGEAAASAAITLLFVRELTAL